MTSAKREPNVSLVLLDHSLNTPEENLALDEALLLECEQQPPDALIEMLRFWESPTHFVVLGVADRYRDSVDLEACSRDSIPILRRASGGGTVLQGPGCLNYSLLLSLDLRSDLRAIDRSYAVILDVIAAALGGDRRVGFQGISDLTLGDLKISGNAQKRKKRTLLHHGTVLYGFETGLIARYLSEPEKQPEYRGQRRHDEFVANLDVSVADIKTRLSLAWQATSEPDRTLPPLEMLITEKYGNPAWTERF
jgi:lipoate-protein ligase A